jgi:hypothetical protein
MAAFLAHTKTATIQRPIFAAADLDNHLRANQASDPAALAGAALYRAAPHFLPVGRSGMAFTRQAS